MTATVDAPETATAPAGGTGENRKSDRRLAFILIAPAVILMLAVTAYPIGYAVWLSLQRYNLAAPDDTAFVGLANYQTVLTDRYWWTAFARDAGDHRHLGGDRVRARNGAGAGDAPDHLR